MTRKGLVSVSHALRVLNRIHTADPSVLPTLLNHRVPCNETLADDPTVQVLESLTNEKYVVGLLGIINGIFGVDERGYGYIAAYYDEQGTLDYFQRTPVDE